MTRKSLSTISTCLSLLVFSSLEILSSQSFAQKSAMAVALDDDFRDCTVFANATALISASPMAQGWQIFAGKAWGWERGPLATNGGRYQSKAAFVDAAADSVASYDFPGKDDQYIDTHHALLFLSHGSARFGARDGAIYKGTTTLMQVPRFILGPGPETYPTSNCQNHCNPSDGTCQEHCNPGFLNDDESSIECGATLDEMRLGNSSQSLEYAHFGNCNSIARTTIAAWRRYWREGLRVATGFHGIARFATAHGDEEWAVSSWSSRWVKSYVDFGEKQYLGWSTREALLTSFHKKSLEVADPDNDSPGHQCPVLVTVSNTEQDAKARAWSHKLRDDENPVHDAPTPYTWAWISRQPNCHAKGETDPWP